MLPASYLDIHCKPTAVQWDIGAALGADDGADESTSPQPGIKFAGARAATLRRSIAAAINELSAERRRPTLTQNQVRAMIGGGAEKPVERAFGAVADSRRSRRAESQRWT
jgi:hypothetical protein